MCVVPFLQLWSLQVIHQLLVSIKCLLLLLGHDEYRNFGSFDVFITTYNYNKNNLFKCP